MQSWYDSWGEWFYINTNDAQFYDIIIENMFFFLLLQLKLSLKFRYNIGIAPKYE